MPRTRTLPLALFAVASLGLVGCGAAAEKAAEKATEQAIESQGGGDVDINADDGTVEVETEDGSMSFGTAEVPEEWPEDIELPDGLEILSGTSMDASDGRLVAITATSEQSPDELLEGLKSQLSDWEISGETDMSSTNGNLAGAQWDTDGRRVTFAASSGGDGNDVSVTIGHTTLS